MPDEVREAVDAQPAIEATLSLDVEERNQLDVVTEVAEEVHRRDDRYVVGWYSIIRYDGDMTLNRVCNYGLKGADVTVDSLNESPLHVEKDDWKVPLVDTTRKNWDLRFDPESDGLVLDFSGVSVHEFIQEEFCSHARRITTERFDAAFEAANHSQIGD